MIDTAALEPYLATVLDEAEIPGLPGIYRGKVRVNYDLPDGRRIIIATDRLSAFDRILTTVPLKGQVLTQTARYWFEATADIAPNHVLAYPDPNVLVARRLRILPVEMVVRDYLAGTTSTSILSMYRAGRREVYGIRLPEGLRDNEKLSETIVTPTTKAFDGGHDEELTPAQIVGRGLLTEAQWQAASALALALFARGREMAAARGLILADTKYEFGFDESGAIVVADEIHTPDSSRYWFAESYQRRLAAGERPDSFDKDYVRSWVAARCDPYRDEVPPIPREVRLEAARLYIEAYERITGERLAMPDPAVPVLERIRGNLAEIVGAVANNGG
ncbi:MAG TPA: phosphoribosylaminoimidazolesuccinocarboxamide synthase [Stellaceae bacterium]|nr:phosphoribosylaminoimidazolesuccinocarboxamide synthase [Stellaceae bacterium]